MKLILYFFVGGISAIVDLGIYSLGIKLLKINWFYISFVSFFIAIIINYCLSIKFVFNSKVRFNKTHEIILVFIISGIGMLLNLIILWILIEQKNIDEVYSKVISTGLVFFWNYNFRKYYIFKIQKY